MKAIGKALLWVLILALVCSAFFGFTGDESDSSDKSFMENIKDGWDNVIDSIFPDKDPSEDNEGEDTDNNSGQGDGDVSQTHNALHIAQSCASTLRYRTPRDNNQWQSINKLSGDPFLCYMLPDDFISFKNTSAQSIYIGGSWKGDVLIEVAPGSESDNLDFSFYKDWYIWSASDFTPSDEELNSNKCVVTFTDEAGELLTVYDEYDNIYSGKDKNSIELVLGREYTFTTSNGTLCIGAEIDSMVIAEFDSDDLFKFTPSATSYGIWLKEGSIEEGPDMSLAAEIYCDSTITDNLISITDSANNDLTGGGITIHYDLDIYNPTPYKVYYSYIGFNVSNKVLVMSGEGNVKLTLMKSTKYYFWVEETTDSGGDSGDDEIIDVEAHIYITENCMLADFSLDSTDGAIYQSSIDVAGGTVVYVNASTTVYLSTIGVGASDGYNCRAQTLILEAGVTYYFYTEGDTQPANL